MHVLFLSALSLIERRPSSGGGCGVFGCFFFILIIGLVIYLVMRGRGDRPEQVAAPKRPQSAGPVDSVTFTSPYAKCPACGAPGDRMKAQWDGMRKVAWTCGYCGTQVGVQELKDEELPESARRRMGIGQPQGGPMNQGYDPNYPQGPGMGGVGGLVTGMMLGSMLGGGSHPHQGSGDGWTGENGGWGSGSSSGDADWGESGGGSDAGSDWGDSGGDSGGDWGGGGDGGGDW